MILVIDTEIDLWNAYCSLSPDLKQHCENVAEYTKILYELAMKEELFPGCLSKFHLQHIKNAVIYHDIGKSVFEKSFLYNKNQMTQVERRLLNRHVEIGLMLFQKTMEKYYINSNTESFLSIAWQSISQHHERFDGSGYPEKRKGNEIAPVGQMCGLCNAYDNLTTMHMNHTEVPHEYVVEQMLQQSGRKFNPLLVDVFAQHSERFRNQLAEKRTN